METNFPAEEIYLSDKTSTGFHFRPRDRLWLSLGLACVYRFVEDYCTPRNIENRGFRDCAARGSTTLLQITSEGLAGVQNFGRGRYCSREL